MIHSRAQQRCRAQACRILDANDMIEHARLPAVLLVFGAVLATPRYDRHVADAVGDDNEPHARWGSLGIAPLRLGDQ
jgi:hypothetical protein